MNDFIFASNVTIIYGSSQMDCVIQEIRKLGTHALLVPAHSFIAAGNLEPLTKKLAEHYAEGSMKTILASLRLSLAESNNKDARGTLLLNSALSLSGINDLGRSFDFVPYPLQSFAQRYLGLNYPQALTGLFPYWLKEIYRASENKAIFYRYFEEILHVKKDTKDDETLLQEALAALSKLYEEFTLLSLMEILPTIQRIISS